MWCIAGAALPNDGRLASCPSAVVLSEFGSLEPDLLGGKKFVVCWVETSAGRGNETSARLELHTMYCDVP